MTNVNLQSFILGSIQFNDLLECLRTDGIILYPTDTIWGIGCDATNETAVKKIYDLKKRELSKPFVLLVDSLEMLKEYVHQVHPRIETLLSFHQRPLTVVYNQAKNLPPISASDTGSVAIRVVQDAFCKQLIGAFGKPLISTSANISTEPFPANFGEVSSAIIEGVNYVVKFRQDEKTMGEPSVVVKVEENGELVFLRT